MKETMQYVVKPEQPDLGEKLPEVSNNPDVEKQWAVTAFMHAETYMKLLQTVDHKKMRLTKIDDDIYTEFRQLFPDLKVDVINEDLMKSAEGKQKWAPFLMSFENRLNMYNFLTLLRLDCNEDYTEQNTTVVPRAQFYCIELARIREGYNKKWEKKEATNNDNSKT